MTIMKKKATLLLSSLLALASLQAYAQAPAIEWDKTYGGSGMEQMSCMTLTPDGGYIFAGGSQSGISGDKTQASRGGQDIWVVRTDASGAIINERTIGGSESDYPHSITPTPDGGYIILANSRSGESGDKDDSAKGRAGRGVPATPEDDLWIIKLNASIDTIQWQKTIGGNNTDRPASILNTADGGYIVGAYSRSGIYGDKTLNLYSASTYDFWILKLNSSGVIQWQKVMGGIGSDNMHAITATSDGGFIAGGYHSGNTIGAPAEKDISDTVRGGNDYWVVKCDASGNIQWEKLMGGDGSDVLSGVIQTSDGGYLLTGGSESQISGDKTEDYMSGNTMDYWIVKLNSTGAIEWDKVYGGTGIDELPVAVETADGGYVIAGESNSRANAQFTNKLTEQPDRHFWMLKINQTGDKVWEKSIGTDSVDKFAAFMATPDGGYIVGGYTVSGVTGDKTDTARGDRDFWVVKLGKDCSSDTTKTYVADVICTGGSYTLPSGAVVSAAGVHYDTVISSANCDSVLVVTLTEPTINTDVTVANGTATAAAQGATYQWINCSDNQPVQGATHASFTPPATGNYAVVVTVDGCSDTSDCQQVIPTSVSDRDFADQVRIYPNPVSSQVYIQAPFVVNVTISTMDGRVVLTHENVRMLDVSMLSEGIYLLRATDASGAVIRTEKLVKIK
jgi:hypothetical protein